MPWPVYSDTFRNVSYRWFRYMGVRLNKDSAVFIKNGIIDGDGTIIEWNISTHDMCDDRISRGACVYMPQYNSSQIASSH